MADARMSNYIALDGERIALCEWPLERGQRRRGTFLIVHGLGEHAGRYEVLAERLNSWGFAVFAYDQYGHGDSGGARGTLPTPTRLLDDLADMIDSTQRHLDPEEPLILLGHSMGGLVAARLVSLKLRHVDALVLSSPALDAGMSRWQKLLIRVLLRLNPDLTVGNGLDPRLLSHEPAVVEGYLNDPLVHDRISARLAQFIAESGPAVLAAAPQWRVPTLLLYAGADQLLNPEGSREFARRAPPGVVSAHRFETLYHEVFNEERRETVLLQLQRWLDALYPAFSPQPQRQLVS